MAAAAVRTSQPAELVLLGSWVADFPVALTQEGAPIHAAMAGLWRFYAQETEQCCCSSKVLHWTANAPRLARVHTLYNTCSHNSSRCRD